MKLSESIQKGVLSAQAGSILNKFKLKERRNILFFEEILAEYFKLCSEEGFGEEIKKLNEDWTNLVVRELMPKELKELPCEVYMNEILNKVWTNLGFADFFEGHRKRDEIVINVKNLLINRIIGRNDWITGFLKATLAYNLNSDLKLVKYTQQKKDAVFVYKILNKPYVMRVKGKGIKNYIRLNRLPRTEGFSLKQALLEGLLTLCAKNRVSFRGKQLLPFENTFFHLVSNANILLNRIPEISCSFFNGLIEKEAAREKKLVLIKNLLQITGWGIINIIDESNNVIFAIRYLPHGLQKERDNWLFLINMIQGYLWLIDKRFTVENIVEKGKELRIIYSV